MSTTLTITGTFTIRDTAGNTWGPIAAPPQPTPSPTPAPLVPSKDGAKVTAPGTTLIDDALNHWRLLAVPNQGNVVQWMPHGTTTWVAAGYSANVVELQKWQATAYQAAVIGGQREYWSWTGTDWATAPGDPSAVPPPVTNANVTV